MKLEYVGRPTCCNCGSWCELTEYKDENKQARFYCPECEENCEDFNEDEGDNNPQLDDESARIDNANYPWGESDVSVE